MSFALVSPIAEAIGLVFLSRSLQNDNITGPNYTILDSGGPRAPWVANNTAHSILTYTYFAYPGLLLLFFIGVFTYDSVVSSSEDQKTDDSAPAVQLGPGGKPLPPRTIKKKKQDKQDVLDFSRPRKLLFIWLSLVVLMTLLGNGALIIAHSVYARDEEWWPGQAYVIYVAASFMVYALLVLSIFDSKPSPGISQFCAWVLAIFMELILLGASFAIYTTDHHEPTVDDPQGGALERAMTEWEIVEEVLNIVRIVSLLALALFYMVFVCMQRFDQKKRQAQAESAQNSDEATSLLDHHAAENGNANGDTPNYGTNGTANGTASADVNGNTKSAPKPPKEDDVPAGWEKPKKVPARSWWEYIRGYAVFFPYLWPAKQLRLQLTVIICVLIMVAQRFVQLLVPYQAGHITDQLSGEEHTGNVKISIALYIVYRFLQGNNGVLGAIRSTLWIPISQYSFRELSVASFEHVHGLSLDFHLGKKTGEVLSALGKGNSINSFLESITFQVLPMLVDLFIAFFYFLYEFDAYYALIMCIITFWYIYITIRMAQWRADKRREMVDADRHVDAVKNDSMVAYETVKYFNAEAFEFNRYRKAVVDYQTAEYTTTWSLNVMNVTQNAIFMAGLMIACFIAAYQVTSGQIKVGKFVSLITYMAQLQQPLNFFGTFYRMIQSNMISAERMLELFKVQPTVVDKEGAQPLVKCEGDLRFKDVHFAYDARKPALKGLDFHAKPGTTVAFVGESGGGKSTVFRLLFRFYNLTSGNILIDDHDVDDVTIDSVRRQIGVVPQDTVLFNDTLMFNLKYANESATDEDVFEACKAASIHDRILSFPDGYQTAVGERGLRLSGGEKQRVAIARTIIKDPKIILLDEATAALDSETEEHIQEALQKLSHGRTVLLIAHRLSTVVDADQILVLKGGECVQRGNHESLLAVKGPYKEMWRRQVKAERAAEHLRAAALAAARLKKEADDGEGEGSTSDDEDVQTQIRRELTEAAERTAS